MAAKLQCEICGGKLVGKPGGIFECENCGTEYSTEWAKAKIQEITGTVKVEGTVEVTGKVQIDGPVKVEGGANKEALLQRGQMALEDMEWEKAEDYFDQILRIDAACGEAYLGLAMAEVGARNRESYAQAYTSADSSLRRSRDKNLIRARQYDAQLNAWFDDLDDLGQKADAELRRKEQEANERRIKRIAFLRDEKITLLHQKADALQGLRGYFNGNKVREIESRLAEIDAEIKKLG